MHNPGGNYIRLPLQNAGNVRDLGGIPTISGVTGFHRFLRSDGLSRLTKDEFDFLFAYGVRTVVDLRTPGESKRDKYMYYNYSEIDYFQLPIFAGDLESTDFETENSNPMTDMYISMVENCKEPLAKIFHTMADAKDGAVLFHCSAGKDRTGLIAALLLSVCGVSDFDILANYAVSEIFFIPQAKVFFDNFDRIPIKYLQSRPEYMEELLKHIDTEYGSAVKYLHSIGVSFEVIDKLNKKLIN